MSFVSEAIHPAPPRPPAELIEAFRPMATAHVSDSMNRLCGAVGLRPYHRAGKLVGCAFTVKTRPGDNLLVHKALDLAGPGDVVVVDGGGDVTQALVGELLGMYARRRGVAGFVIDGAIRDVRWYDDFPCYARANTHRGPYKDGPGEINVPVSIGGLVIAPGDIVLGDEDGVVAIHPAEAGRVLEMARAKMQDEERDQRAILEGRWDREWVDRTLRARAVVAP
jgi:regulator of RNase E activity RraA